MSAIVGTPVSRVDGPAKVTGRATYAAEFDIPGLVHAALVTSAIASGRITAIDAGAARVEPGVIAVLTHENAPRLPYEKARRRPPIDPKVGERLHVLQGPDVLFSGQPVAMVVAETLEAARRAAAAIRVSYEEAPSVNHFEAEASREPEGKGSEDKRGEAEAALEKAAIRVDSTYEHAREQHNAIEPHATIAVWDGGRLTLYDKTQWVGNDRDEIARVFGMDKGDIRVISPYIGGAFGSALRTWPHVTLAALAARETGRPVRLELTRRELFTSVGARPQTWQRVILGADGEGRLTALVHEAVSQTSQYEEYTEATVDPSRSLYACPNVATRYRVFDMNINTPCPMRTPGVVSGVFALEVAMDELAAEAGLDPVELRLRNFAGKDQESGLPWSSNGLKACYAMAAERFGWAARNPEPGAMRAGRLHVGYGMATAVYPAHRAPASASVALNANGTASVRTAASDMGPGTYTSLTQIAAETLGLPVDKVHLEIGDTDMPVAPVHGGSITLASVGNAVAAAARAVLDRLGTLDGAGTESDFGALLTRNGLDRLEAEGGAKPGEETQTHSSSAFGAVFVEVRVDPDFGTVRVKRMIGSYDVGRVVNPKLARSQCIGGMVGGIGMALMERVEWDERYGRVMNANLAEYLVPVSADIGELEALFVEGEDTIFNPLGAKGVGEIALAGVAPAVANAVFHATGRRVRSLPILPEALIQA